MRFVPAMIMRKLVKLSKERILTAHKIGGDIYSSMDSDLCCKQKLQRSLINTHVMLTDCTCE